jgi:hypothetical protein
MAGGTATTTSGCNELATALPALGFCGTAVAPAELVKLGEGPALFVDAMRIVASEVATQAQLLAKSLQGGVQLDQNALQAVGPYKWQGGGTYSRQAATDRAFRLRFFYGSGVAGKTAGTPIESDLARLDSYVPNLLNPAQGGPLFPLVEAAGFSSGRLGFRDEALRFDLGSLVTADLKGYGLNLNVGTTQNTVGSLLKQLGERKLAFSLGDTAMTNTAAGFKLAVKKFDLTVGLDGKADLGGDYLFEVANGGLKYFGAVKTAGGIPALSLRCGEDQATEFATMSFVDGKADMKLRTDNFPINLPGLAPLLASVK